MHNEILKRKKTEILIGAIKKMFFRIPSILHAWTRSETKRKEKKVLFVALASPLLWQPPDTMLKGNIQRTDTESY
jgi:hypothetical protein